jgi:hypothetical protein
MLRSRLLTVLRVGLIGEVEAALSRLGVSTSAVA